METHPKKLETLSYMAQAPRLALLEMGGYSGVSVLAFDYSKEELGVCDPALAASALRTDARQVAVY